MIDIIIKDQNLSKFFSKTILIWEWTDAPEEFKKLSDNGGDEDWVALVPLNYPHYIPWLDHGSFGACDISNYQTIYGTIYIGAHA